MVVLVWDEWGGVRDQGNSLAHWGGFFGIACPGGLTMGQCSARGVRYRSVLGIGKEWGGRGL